jgi:hypothetical protein
MEDGTTLHIDEVRTGKKELAAVSMRKFPATMDAESVASNLHPNVRDDSGTGTTIVRNPGANKAESEAEPGLRRIE